MRHIRFSLSQKVNVLKVRLSVSPPPRTQKVRVLEW
jgi:hypothetical protein